MNDKPCTASDRAAIIQAATGRMRYLAWLMRELYNRPDELSKAAASELEQLLA